MKIALAAAEAVPYCKTGGLADVAGALPAALKAHGVEALLFVPYYAAVREKFPDVPAAAEIAPRVAGADTPTKLRRREGVVFVDCPRYFDRPGLYGDKGADYPDNAERYALFARAVVAGAPALGFQADVFHGHDWQAGLIPALLRLEGRPEASVFTIHNLAYQGNFPKEALAAAGLPAAVFTPEGLEFYGQVSYMKAGLVYADLLSTVSPRYAEEIRTEAFGAGMDGLLRGRGGDLRGILNGIDAAAWDPRSDKALPRNYGPADAASGKAECKRAVQLEAGIEVDGGAPLIAMVTRLDRQKGIDVALAALAGAVAGGAQAVLIGTGDLKLEAAAAAFAKAHPGRVCWRGTFDDPFARRTYAGADIFLMPSRFEPCGLGQLIAMRYGALPVAVRTGGLADTVEPSGWLAAAPEAPAVGAALAAALAAYAGEGFGARAAAAMKRDFSWDAAAAAYAVLYKDALARRRHGTAA